MFITRSRHERELAQARDAAARAAQYFDERISAGAIEAASWRQAAQSAWTALADLQRRYAPPEPITEEITQPASLDEADRAAAERQRAKDQETA